ncbi:hypothetical protein DFH05DRAFT_1462735 [Lentinula detonsa]|uniref:Uncharacterized protein n=1 Tax=Lentinula detonsa TaxID=2804962 RepID=A0A9W8NTY9_9AGAR|nr:hypothetical protein DFH05DRAFT_1462735 [Lentinula detonsa]
MRFSTIFLVLTLVFVIYAAPRPAAFEINGQGAHIATREALDLPSYNPAMVDPNLLSAWNRMSKRVLPNHNPPNGRHLYAQLMRSDLMYPQSHSPLRPIRVSPERKHADTDNNLLSNMQEFFQSPPVKKALGVNVYDLTVSQRQSSERTASDSPIEFFWVMDFESRNQWGNGSFNIETHTGELSRKGNMIYPFLDRHALDIIYTSVSAQPDKELANEEKGKVQSGMIKFFGEENVQGLLAQHGAYVKAPLFDCLGFGSTVEFSLRYEKDGKSWGGGEVNIENGAATLYGSNWRDIYKASKTVTSSDYEF